MNKPQSALHEHTLRSGYGCVPYALATNTVEGHHYPQGWVLPGGRRTSNPGEARAVADWIDQVTRAGHL